MNSITVRLIDVLLGFGAGYGIYKTTDNLVYGIIVGIGFFFVLFLLYARTFPVIAQAEVKSILKASGEKYKNIRDNKNER